MSKWTIVWYQQSGEKGQAAPAAVEIPEQKPTRRGHPCRIALALPKFLSKIPLDCWLQEFQEQYRASNGLRCAVSAVVALAVSIGPADFHSIRKVQVARSPDY